MIINCEKKVCQIIDVAISRIERIIPNPWNLQEGLGSDENTEEVQEIRFASFRSEQELVLDYFLKLEVACNNEYF
jgi:hypothetical protein